METAKQLSVSLVNKPGRLAAMLAGLSKGKVALRALAVMDSGDRGTVRFVPNDFASAVSVLKTLGISHQATNVLLVDVPRQVGAFRSVCERLAADHLNIDYAYSSFSEGGVKGGLAVIKVNNIPKAQQVLAENGASSARKQFPTRRLLHTR
jgi:hypothetical protein